MLHGLDLLRQQYLRYAAQGARPPSDTVATLAHRLGNVALPHEDRRAAIISIKALVRDHPDAVSEHALVPLLRWIKNGERDEDMLRAAVESCLALCQSPDESAKVRAPLQSLTQSQARARANMGRLLEEKDALLTLLSLLSPDHSFYTRFAALQLLATLVDHRRSEVQEYVLAAPGGCSAVLQCLEAAPSSSTEIIRNEALLLLPQLVRDSIDIQKIVAFEGAFERILDIIAQEGRIEGGVVVQDALEGLEVLLRHNVSNQNYFRETLSIPLLAPLLFYPPPLAPNAPEAAAREHASLRDAFLLQEWDEQKLANALLLLRCVRHLVDGHGDGHRANQLAMRNGGLAECLVQLALASLAPPALKAHTLHVLATLLRGSRPIQDLFSTMVVTPVALIRRDDAPPELSWQAPQPAMLCLISLALRGPSATSPAKALAVRAAALQAFEALVLQNMEVRMTLLHALVAAPLPEQLQSHAGQLLDAVAHLPTTPLVGAPQTRFDPYMYLFASTMLSYLLQVSDTAKAFVRQVRLDADGRCVVGAPRNEAHHDTDDDAPPILIHVVVGNLAMALREHAEAVRRERAAIAAEHANSSQDWAHIIVGYLTLLAQWLWQSSSSVADFLSESANLQIVVQPAAQATGVDPLVQGLATFVLGVAYEFNPLMGEDSSEGIMTRHTMHSILRTRIGVDEFGTRLVLTKSDARFYECTPEVLEDVTRHMDDPEPPALWFSWPFVEFWKDTYVRVQKAILVAPNASSATEAEAPAELVDARQQIATLQAEVQRLSVDAAAAASLRAELDELRASDAKADAQAKAQELVAVQAELDAVQKALAAAQADAASRMQELAAATSRADATSAELAAAKGDAEARAQELAAVRADLDATRGDASRAASAAPASDASAELARLQVENEDLLVLLDELTEKRQRDKARMREARWDVSEDEEDL